MARIRSLKPEAPQHRKIGRLSIHARWLWLVMITQADDEGRLVADNEQLRLWAFGYDEITTEQVNGWLQEVARTGLVRLYSVRAVRYAAFPSWRDHQRIDRPTPSKLPDPPQLRSTSPRRVLDERSTNAREGSEGIGEEGIGSDRKGGDGNAHEATPPAPLFFLWPEIEKTLGRCRILGAAKPLHDPTWWLAEMEANQTVDLVGELFKAEAWLVSNPRRGKADYRRFLHNWLSHAEREE